MSESVWVTLLEKFGLPLVLLVAVLWLFWKKILPYIQHQQEKFESTLREQVLEARAARGAELDKFLKAIDSRDEVQVKHTVAIERLIAAVDEIRRGVKKGD